MQLYNLKSDRGEQENLIAKHPKRVQALLRLLDQQVSDGRSTPGNHVPNDREVTFLPPGISIPVTD